MSEEAILGQNVYLSLIRRNWTELNLGRDLLLFCNGRLFNAILWQLRGSGIDLRGWVDSHITENSTKESQQCLFEIV